MDQRAHPPGGHDVVPVRHIGSSPETPSGYHGRGEHGGYPGYRRRPHTSHGGADGRGGFDLFRIIPILRRRWKLVTATTALGIAAAAAWVALEPPAYRANAVIRVGEAREALTQGIETQGGDEIDRFVNPFLSAIQLIRSRSLLGGVVDKTGLRLDPPEREFREGLLRAPAVAQDAQVDTLRLEFASEGYSVSTRDEEGFALYGQRVAVDGVSFAIESRPSVDRAVWVVTPRERVIDRLVTEVSVSPRDQTNIVDVSFVHASPHTAQRVVNTLVEAYQNFEAQFAQERASRRRVFLEEQVAETDSRLAEAQQQLSAFQTRAQSYDAAGELAAEQQNRLLLRVRIAELDGERRMALTMLDSLEMAPTDDDRWSAIRTLVSSPGIGDNVVVTQLHDRLLRQRSLLDSLTAGGFGAAANSPDVRRQRDLVQAAEGELTDAIRSHVRALDARAVALQELAQRTDSALANIPSQLAQEDRLVQVVTTYQNLSDQLRQEYQLARMSEAVTVGQADIIDLAALPYQPAPNLLVVKLGLGFLLGLTFGGAGAFAFEFRRRSLSSKEEIETLFRLPVLGVVPASSDPSMALVAPTALIGTKSQAVNGIMRDEKGRFVSAKQAQLEAASAEEDDQAVDGTDEPGPPADDVGASGRPPVVKSKAEAEKEAERAFYAREAYRMLCTNLFFAGWTKDARTLSITSTVPQEGKTLTAANLAVAMAGEGLQVLLVDADIWRGRIHDIFEIPSKPGLGEMLRGDAEAGLLQVGKEGTGAVHASRVPGLWLLPRGESGPNPSLLTRRSNLKAVLEGLREDFDIVLVDGPPVLAAGSAPVVSAVTDGVLMLVKAGYTDRESIEEALKELGTVGARVLGAILNDPDNVTSAELRRYHYYEYAKS